MIKDDFAHKIYLQSLNSLWQDDFKFYKNAPEMENTLASVQKLSRKKSKKDSAEKNENKLSSLLESMLMCISEFDSELADSFRKELDALEIKTTIKTSGTVSDLHQMWSYPKSDDSSLPF